MDAGAGLASDLGDESGVGGRVFAGLGLITGLFFATGLCIPRGIATGGLIDTGLGLPRRRLGAWFQIVLPLVTDQSGAKASKSVSAPHVSKFWVRPATARNSPAPLE